MNDHCNWLLPAVIYTGGGTEGDCDGLREGGVGDGDSVGDFLCDYFN